MEDYKQLDELPNYLVGPNGELYSKRNRRNKKWCIGGPGYLVTRIVLEGKHLNISQHRLVYAYYNPSFKMFDKTKLVIDHINSIKTDNSVSNLRLVSYRENISKERRTKREFPLGVSPNRGRFQVAMRIGGKIHHLGVFNCPTKASIAYETALSRYNELGEIPPSYKEDRCTSKEKYVSYASKRNKWRLCIPIEGKTYRKSFDTEAEAIAAKNNYYTSRVWIY